MNQGQQFADGELVELGQGVAAPFPAEGLGLEPRAVALGAGVVGPVAREEDAHVHFVGPGFQVAEEPLDPIPAIRPLPAGFQGIARLSFDDEGLLLGRKCGERDVGR